MKNTGNNYAFIDGQNLNLGIKSLGWNLDFRRFRIYLKEKYRVTTAYYFIGYMPENKGLYHALGRDGYKLIFKPVITDNGGDPKGNVDANLVLQAMLDYNNYDKAIIITSDGDFYCLIEYLYKNSKLERVISPYIATCSVLLKKTAKEKILFMDNLRQKLEYKKKNTA